MKRLSEQILEVSRDLPRGEVLLSRDFSHLGGRAAVSKSLSRLVNRGCLFRISRGIYVVPIISRFGERAPSADDVVRALALKSKELIVVSGAHAANALGLTLQVPVKAVFYTTGRPRSLQLGSARIEIIKVPYWQLALGNSLAGDAVRALEWVGEPHAHSAARKLRKLLPDHEWQALLSARSMLPGWMADAVGSQISFDAGG